MSLIEISGLTKDYGRGRGVFDVDLSVAQGESFGFVGINGAGKTTLIRHLMGFLHADSGSAAIGGLDCWAQSATIKEQVGYVPGEIAFPDARTGTEFLRWQADLLGLADMSYADYLVDKLQLDPTANLRRMSKGMKQKTALVAALMADRPILVLDEPTTGLDPLMRAEFIDVLAAEKRKGKTIFMSSHMFDEVERICDSVGLIRDGHIVDVKSTREIRHNEEKVYKIELASPADYARFVAAPLTFSELRPEQNQAIVTVNDAQINDLFATLRDVKINFINENKYTLEDYFRGMYQGAATS